MNAQDYNALTASVKVHEGLRLRVYPDTKGILTIGYGRNLIANGIRVSEAELMLENDLDEAVLDCRSRFPWTIRLDGTHQAVLAELDFAMGGARLAGFQRMLAALQCADYATAAAELRNSEWAQTVGQARTNDLAHLLEFGKGL